MNEYLHQGRSVRSPDGRKVCRLCGTVTVDGPCRLVEVAAYPESTPAWKDK